MSYCASILKYLSIWAWVSFLSLSCSSPTSTATTESTFDWQISYPDASTESHHWAALGGTVFGGWISDTTTSIQLTGGSEDNLWSVLMFIPGTSIGTYPWGTDAIFPDIEIDTDINSFDYFVSDSGATEITTFGDIGGRITGRFSGRFYKRSELFGDPLKIQGSFDVVRLEDNRVVTP